MAGNDDLASIDQAIAEFPHVHNPDMSRFEIEGGYEIVGLSNANMTPWRCARDIEEEELAGKLETLSGMIQNPEKTIAVLHVPPYGSGLDTCPDLDENLKIDYPGRSSRDEIGRLHSGESLAGEGPADVEPAWPYP